MHYREADIPARACSSSSSTSDNNNSAGSSDSSSSSSSDSRRGALRRLQSGVPTASDGSHGAWQFKMALEVGFRVGWRGGLIAV